jgi:hypothetical protein
MRRLNVVLTLCLLSCASFLKAADEPDGTAFSHSVLSIDSADMVRIKYCGMPLQVKLANIQFKGTESEKEGLKYLKEMLKAGTQVKIELEPDLNMDSPAPPLAQVFAGSTHINLEMVKQGAAISDGRSKKYGSQMQASQMDAMTKKVGLWSGGEAVLVPPNRPVAPPANTQPPEAVATAPVLPETAPPSYSSAVVADLSSKEYHYPGSRYAKNIRAAARIEYKSPEEAERAGKQPSPFSFPDRAKEFAAKQSTKSGAMSNDKIIEEAKKAYAEAAQYMQEARKVSKTNNAAANENWKKASKILTEQIDRVLPIADQDPNNRELQKLCEDMSMNLYSCKKYQSL